MGQIAQNRIILPALLVIACLYLSSTARADTIARPDFSTFANPAMGNSLESRHLTPQPSNGTSDPNDDGTISNHPNANATAGGSTAYSASLIAGAKVTGAPPQIPWLWIIVTGALSLTALGMGGHIVLRDEPA